MSMSSKDNLLSPDGTAQGTLPPFEVAKAWAFETVLKHMEKHLGRSAWMLLGEEKTKFIAKHLQLNGAGLVQLSINELIHDIRLSPFAARRYSKT